MAAGRADPFSSTPPGLAGMPEGLTSDEAAVRLRASGPNRLPEPRGPGVARRSLRSLRDPLVVVLLAALGLTLLTGDLPDAAVIALVVVVNTVLGVRQEVSADRAVRALSQAVAPHVTVLRDGRTTSVPIEDVVPGDLVLVHQGDVVPADGTLVTATGVEVDESMLTGESVPIAKAASTGPLPGSGTLDGSESDRLSAGTLVVQGHATMRVTATGAGSRLGQIAALVATAAAPATPLQRRMARLSGVLAVAAILLSAVVLLLGVARGQPAELMLLTAIALIVAAVPESLPLVVTVTLAIAARRMAARHAVVRDLAAVETLGSVTVLATDKTGTLTEGTMRVAHHWRAPGVGEAELLKAAALCNNALLQADGAAVQGNATDRALLDGAVRGGVDVEDLRARWPVVAEVPFDSAHKWMETAHVGADGRHLVVRKGAPELVLADLCGPDVPADPVRDALAVAAEWGHRGIRTIALVGQRDEDRRPRVLGLIGIDDPLRASSQETIRACHDAGLKVVMITGDHPETAAAIAAAAGVSGEGSVVARATPEDKHRLIGEYRRRGHVVAMTGDGVNDAPALRSADIGVAMGRRGTEVARQAADLVLTDDELQTVVAAVEEGRRVYDNIRRFLVYALAGGGSEVLVMLLGPLWGLPLPLLPGQILWLNLLTHSFAGAGLAAQAADPDVLHRGPRPPDEEPLRGLAWRTAVIATYLAAAALAASLLTPASPQPTALLALGCAQLAVAWGMRTRGAPVRQGRHPDPLVPSLALAGAMLLAAVVLPPLMVLLGTTTPGASGWWLAAATGVGALLLTRLLRANRV